MNEVEHGSIHRGDWFFRRVSRHEGETANEFATSASGEILQQFVDEIATDLENLEANLKGSTCAQRRKKHGVGTHSQTGKREETVNVFKQAQSNTPKNYN